MLEFEIFLSLADIPLALGCSSRPSCHHLLLRLLLQDMHFDLRLQYDSPSKRISTFRMAQRHYIRTSATRYRCGDNRTKMKPFATSAWYHWWHVGPYFWPVYDMRICSRTANPITLLSMCMVSSRLAFHDSHHFLLCRINLEADPSSLLTPSCGHFLQLDPSRCAKSSAKSRII